MLPLGCTSSQKTHVNALPLKRAPAASSSSRSAFSSDLSAFKSNIVTSALKFEINLGACPYIGHRVVRLLNSFAEEMSVHIFELGPPAPAWGAICSSV